MTPNYTLLYTFLFLIFSIQIQAQVTINVPEDYATIQAALNSAENGTTIIVGPGVYNENINWPGKNSITLQSSQGRNQTTIDVSHDRFFITNEYNEQYKQETASSHQ